MTTNYYVLYPRDVQMYTNHASLLFIFEYLYFFVKSISRCFLYY